jgi:hypothetical protein
MKLTIDLNIHRDRGTASLLALINFLKEYKISMSEAVDRLKAAVNADITANQDGFTAFEDALKELASDIADLPDADDVDAEATRLSENTTKIQEAFATAAQQIRDAIPTKSAAPDTTGAVNTAPVDTVSEPPVDGGTSNG